MKINPSYDSLHACCCVDRDVYHAGGLSRARVMLTIHNMDNSGECRQDEFAYTGAPHEHIL